MTDSIDLNSDLGEGYGAWSMGADDDMLAIVSSANIACGYHAGDPDIMATTLALCAKYGVTAGAHPSYPDRDGFGRRAMPDLKGDSLTNHIVYQLGALSALASTIPISISHVRTHGALANASEFNLDLAHAVADAIRATEQTWMIMAGSPAAKLAQELGIPHITQAFADRAYHSDYRLQSRQQTGAVLHDSEEIVERAWRMFQEQSVVSVEGDSIPMLFDSLCVHGDTPGAVRTAEQLRQRFEQGGVCIEAAVARIPT